MGKINTSNFNTQVVIQDPQKDFTLQRVKRRVLKHVWLARIFSIAGILLGLYLLFILAGAMLSKIGITNYSELVSDFIFTPLSKIRSIEGRTNVLILGKSGPGHAGSDLTDTMIFASVSLNSKGIATVSLPRDIWIPEIRAKINSAYYWGNQKQPGGGLVMAKSTVEEIVGVPIQYGAVVDFSAFKSIVDVIGGINVNVERSFTDNKYPIAGRENDLCDGDKEFKCRYETIHFEKGTVFMNGETALKFVRSRNAEGEEGTDLARDARQQKVIAAIKEKILSPQIILNPKKILDIWKVVKNSVETDITPSAGAILARETINSRAKINSYVLPVDLLDNPSVSSRYDNQYVFVPKEGDWSKVQNWIKNLLR